MKIYVLIIALGVLGFIGLETHEGDGFHFRAYNNTVMQYSDSMVRVPGHEECFGILYAHNKKENWFCELGVKSNSIDYFAYGDSHALSLIPALEIFGQTMNKKILFTGTSGCPPLLGIQSLRGPKKLE